MPSLTAAAVFEQEFLSIRARLLDIAASLDRIDRAGGPPPNDSQMDKIRQALEVLPRPDRGRAEQIQLVFSLPYDENWREKFRMTNGG